MVIINSNASSNCLQLKKQSLKLFLAKIFGFDRMSDLTPPPFLRMLTLLAKIFIQEQLQSTYRIGYKRLYHYQFVKKIILIAYSNDI